MPTLTRFRQKHDSIFYLGFLSTELVKGLSLHMACTMTAKDSNLHLLWSRHGLQFLCSFATKHFTALGMHEAANMQTSLELPTLDIKHPQLKVFHWAPLQFVQLYTDSPHCHTTPRHYHPVSGIVVLCGLLHLQSQASLNRSAEEYINHVHDCNRKMVGQLSLRIEAVTYIDHSRGIHSFYRPRDFINEVVLESLFQTFPLVLPILDSVDMSLMQMFRDCLEYIPSDLIKIYMDSAGKGGSEQSWRAFQLEMAFEELVYGHPLSPLSRKYSAPLGTCTTNPKSLTHQRGFLGLAPYNSGAVGDCPPEFRLWTTNPQLMKRLDRMFPITDLIHAAPVTLGVQLVHLILGDLHSDSLGGVPVATLKGDKLPTGVLLMGSHSFESLTEQLAKAKFPFPYTFGRVRAMLEEENMDLSSLILLGLVEYSPKFFPMLWFQTTSRVSRVTVVPNKFHSLHSLAESPTKEAKLATLVTKVANNIEDLGLCYASKIER